ncbi:MAG TPA: hypothetical protein DCX19_05015 [Alphaproteobacteria bacterium]|nr:hypothetical protein [Alphaproteobacteria bacterium]
MPELPIVMVNDFLDTEVRGIFTTQYVEGDEMLLRHNASGLKVKIVKDEKKVAAWLFSFTNGWVEIAQEAVSAPATFMPMSIPKPDEIAEAEERDATIRECREYNGFRFLKNIAILLGDNPEDMDEVRIDVDE